MCAGNSKVFRNSPDLLYYLFNKFQSFFQINFPVGFIAFCDLQVQPGHQKGLVQITFRCSPGWRQSSGMPFCCYNKLCDPDRESRHSRRWLF